jgi:hypothetical protein
MKIDFNTRKTEAGWQKVFDNFWIKATPKWFEWLRWLLIIGVFTILSKTQENTIIEYVLGISYVALFFYFQSFFFSIEFHGLPFVKSEKARRTISLILSAALLVCTGLFLSKVILPIISRKI